MTVQSTTNIIVHIAIEGQDTYGYDFLVLQDEHIFLYLDSELYEGGYQVLGTGDQDGGSIVLDDPILPDDDGRQLAIVRILEPTQELDYTTYDGFPALSHERGLDKLTMLIQQATNTLLNAIHIPTTENAFGINTTVPPVRDRAEKVLYFDIDGNVTVLAPDIDAPAVFRVDVQDGSNGHDSRTLLHVETVSGGANYPKVGFRNVNQPLGPLQLNEQGKIPRGMIDILGLTVRGPYRGDDLCDKLEDSPGDCVPPDFRNPSERFPNIVFTNGDTFIITMGEDEVSGSINLIPVIGSDTPEPVEVKQRDGIIFLEDIRHPDTDEILAYEGWYHYPKMVEVGDASFIIYDDSGNTYVLGNNVQAALDSTDNHLVDRNAWYLTERTPTREGLAHTDANAIFASGIYALPAGSSNLPDASNYTLICMNQDSDTMGQLAINLANGSTSARSRNAGAWTAWIEFAEGASAVSKNGDTMLGQLNGPGTPPALAISYVEKQYVDDTVFPVGTRMVFAQNAPPTGWSQDTSDTANNRMLRVVNIGGGGVAGTDSPILNNTVPSHTHGVTGSANSTSLIGKINSGTVGSSGCFVSATGIASVSEGVSGIADRTTSFSSFQGANINATHTHTLNGTANANAGAANWAPRYINLVIGVKL